MLTKTPGYEEFYHVKDYVSFSSLASFHRCPRRFFYKACGLCVKEHAALTFGKGIHSGISHARKGELDEAMKAFLNDWGETEDTDKRNKGTALELFHKFSKTHPSEGGLYEIVRPPEGENLSDRRSDDEVSFLIDIGADKLLFGRIDSIGRMLVDVGLYTVEYKTTSEMGSLFIQAFENHPQLLTYYVGLQALSFEEVKGCIVEGFRTGKKTEVMTLPPFMPSEHVVNQFIEETVETVTRILEYEQNQTFPQCRFGCTCHPCYGKAWFYCEYQHLCSVEDWRSLRDIYEVKFYDPLEKPSENTQEEEKDGLS